MEENTQERDSRPDPREMVLDLNFVPQWARRPPGESHYRQEGPGGEELPPRYARDDRRPPRRPRGERPPPGRGRDDRRPPRREGRGDDFRPEPGRPEPGRPEPGRPARPPREPVVELPLEISFLPEQQRLASLVRQIHHSRRAYPLIDLASLLVHDPEGYLVKIEGRRDAAPFAMQQCRLCKSVAVSEEAIRQHLLSKHLADFYDREEIETDPPSGSFPGVARCTLTGELLGPPNHHSYAEKLAELHQARFAHLSLDELKRNVEIVRDDALVEQWKQQCRHRTAYREKGDPAAEPVDLRRAELAFAQKLPSLHETVHRAVVPARTAQNIEDPGITHAIRREWLRESRFPLTTSFAMRAAFRHMHLHLFKAGRINFVTHIKPHPIDPKATIDRIAEVLLFLKEHPGSTRGHLLECLHPSLDPASKEAQEALQPLGWLIERGHIIEFFNGTLAVPLGRTRRR